MMNYIAIDDEPLALEDFEETLQEAVPGCASRCFTLPGPALEYLKENAADVAFLDIEMGNTNGLAIAKRIKELQPDIHIIFVTSYGQYALDAFQLHASGYLLKPVTPEDIRRELTFLYGAARETRRIVVRTFGGFDVFADSRPLRFRRSKSKELLAYLVDKRGISITCGEACAVLWEDRMGASRQKSYFRTILADLRSTLRQYDADDILIKGYNRIAINPSKIDCDSYRFLEGDPRAVNSYRHDYMSCYSWAEFSVGDFERREF